MIVCTEAERDALMAAVTDAITETLTRLNVRDCKSLGSMAGKEAGAVIRAILAPPDDAVKAIQLALKALDREKGEAEDNLKRATLMEDQTWMKRYQNRLNEVKQAIALLRGEATRDGR